MGRGLTLFAVTLLVWGCETPVEPDDRDQEVGYRTGTRDDGYTSNGERGNVNITEVMWAGSIEGTGPAALHHPGDIFIELQNKHPRPIHLTGWQLTIRAGHFSDGLHHESRADRSSVTYTLPLRAGGQAVEPNEFVVVATRADGAWLDPDYVLPDLRLANGPFAITLRDRDERLIDGAGEDRKPPFAGARDGVTARAMERIQLIFNNRGNRDASWHTYSLNDFDDGERGALHQSLRARVREEYRAATFATPGYPNSPDYSGYISSGSFE
jgi:hypothetical protein